MLLIPDLEGDSNRSISWKMDLKGKNLSNSGTEVQKTLRKNLIIALIIFVATIGFVLESYGQPQPQYGGILRRINPTGTGPRVLPRDGSPGLYGSLSRSRMPDGAE